MAHHDSTTLASPRTTPEGIWLTTHGTLECDGCGRTIPAGQRYAYYLGTGARACILCALPEYLGEGKGAAA